MTAADTLSPAPLSAASGGDRALKAAATFWFVVTVVGQMVFAAYTAVFYGGAALEGDVTRWNEVLFRGIIEGDWFGNAMLGLHVVLAFLITVGGPVQLIPAIRSRFPAFHRWNGRVYIATALVISVGALYLVWTRGVFGGFWNGVSVSINGLLIIAFSLIAVRYAMARQIAVHQRWAMRLFLVVSGVWFFRVGLMFWFLAAQGAWIGDALDGPVGRGLGFAQYLLPLAVYEVYWRAREYGGVEAKYAMSGLLIALTFVTAIGVGMATVFMWLPRM